MATPQQLGGPTCATCSGQGITTGLEGQPIRCAPCTPERIDEALRVLGFVPECNGCTTILTVAEYGHHPRTPERVRLRGVLCDACARSLMARQEKIA
jgi:hypothetical protein